VICIILYFLFVRYPPHHVIYLNVSILMRFLPRIRYSTRNRILYHYYCYYIIYDLLAVWRGVDRNVNIISYYTQHTIYTVYIPAALVGVILNKFASSERANRIMHARVVRETISFGKGHSTN